MTAFLQKATGGSLITNWNLSSSLPLLLPSEHVRKHGSDGGICASCPGFALPSAFLLLPVLFLSDRGFLLWFMACTSGLRRSSMFQTCLMIDLLSLFLVFFPEHP
jgi:hypothetical protein